MLDLNIRILLVEDNDLTIEACREFMISLNYPEPLVATRGEDAVAQVADFRPDIILMDINLAGSINGIEAARQIQAMNLDPAPCFLFLTGDSTEDLIEKVISITPRAYLPKPFNGMTLHASIQVAMANHRSREKLVTQARETEQVMLKYISIFENSMVGICFIDGDGLVKAVNRRGLEILGLSEKTEIVGMNIRDFHGSLIPSMPVGNGHIPHNHDSSMTFDDLYSAMTGKGSMTHLEHSILRRSDGTKANLVFSGSAISMGDGTRGIVWVYEDVTGMRELEETRNANQRLVGAMEMAGALAHEMNQSLQYILGYSQMLVEDVLRTLDICKCTDRVMLAEIRDSATRIGEAASKLGETTSRMARVSRYAIKEYLPGTNIIDLDAAIEAASEHRNRLDSDPRDR